jgi:hypothetical protein
MKAEPTIPSQLAVAICIGRSFPNSDWFRTQLDRISPAVVLDAGERGFSNTIDKWCRENGRLHCSYTFGGNRPCGHSASDRDARMAEDLVRYREDDYRVCVLRFPECNPYRKLLAAARDREIPIEEILYWG